MMEDRLNSSLLNMGYQRLNSNAQGIYLFYRTVESEITIVSVIHVPNGNEIAIEQYGHILKQIKENFAKTYPGRIQLLSLIFTRFPNRVKSFCTLSEESSHWIIDLSTNRLMIYETQLNDFAGMKGLIEQLLEEEQNQEQASVQKDTYNVNSFNQVRTSKMYQFTLVNTIIVIINIIIFMIYRFTNAFGGEELMFDKGALSWYYVINGKEYYRFFTSMFMHADWSHLFNNMIVLLFVGANLERAAGKLKYLFIYFGTGILAGISSISYNMWKENAHFATNGLTFSIGASGAIFGVVGAILYIVIANRGRLEQIGTRQMVLFILLSLYSGVANSQIDQAAHIGGFFAGLLLALILYRRPKNTLKDVERTDYI